ncbi:MAG: gamma carbonic anhydrase family protein [Gemmatimonadetes bacterium]|nr:gamma carbonic anhydrase family protein [Gemmatimonadota bacterium]
MTASSQLVPFGGRRPRVHPSAFIAPTAVLIGEVEVGEAASIWFGAVLRADDPEHGIRIGARTSIQDNCVLHVSARGPTIVGSDATIGHGACLESCTIAAGALVGMKAVILPGAAIGAGALVAAGSVVPENMQVPAGVLVAGAPATIRKQVTGESARLVREGVAHYVALARAFLAEATTPEVSGE